MTDAAIETTDLAKVFGDGVMAVNSLDLRVPPGCVYGLIGRNGAGKTTTLRLLMGLLRPSRGTARVLGMDMWTASRRDRARVAYVGQGQQLLGWLTTQELCRYVSHFYEQWDQSYAESLAKRFDLGWTKVVRTLSGGQQRKVAVLLALAARPRVLLLDEPAAGLDPIARRELVDELVDVLATRDGTTIVLSTHIIGDLERLAERVGFMDRGRIVLDANLDELRGRLKRVQVIFEGPPPPGFTVPGAVRTRTEGSVVTAVVNLASPTQLDDLLASDGARVQVFDLGLEELFIGLFADRGEKLDLAEVGQ